jgi:hypothetical protein
MIAMILIFIDKRKPIRANKEGAERRIFSTNVLEVDSVGSVPGVILQ